jgi:CRISPR-associated protein Csd1
MILQALDRYYDRMAARGEAEPPGWAKAPIGWEIELSRDGEPLAVNRLLDPLSKKPRPPQMSVPAPVKRTVAITPNAFWDKTAYALGRTAGEGRRTADEHAAFRRAMLDLIGNSDDQGLLALRRFLEHWTPGRFDSKPFTPDMLDANVVFRLSGERGYIHERAAARALLRQETATAGDEDEVCLVTGVRAPVRRLHPTIKGVNGAQSSGASLVSFNLDAFKSYGRDQGANAPTSEAAAERYGAALNAMLASASPNRLRRGIGDATVVFWADASGAADEGAANAAEALFAQIFAPPPEAVDDDGDVAAAARVRDALTALAEGRPQTLDPQLKPGVRFNVLGLSPNAARLSVRFWLSDSFGAFAKAILAHVEDLAIEPPPRGWSGKKGPPEIWRLLVKTTAVQEKFENVPPLLAGELARAVLGGGAYPRTWLVAAVVRLRAGDAPYAGWHAAAIKACINRQNRIGREHSPGPFQEDLPVALDPQNNSVAYQLGRLFAVIEAAQYAALGRVNATVADRYYGAASSTPARVFAALLRNARNHVSDAKRRGGGGWIEKKLDEIVGRLPADLPRTLKLEDQGRFAVGYYHERASRPAREAGAHVEDADVESATANANA